MVAGTVEQWPRSSGRGARGRYRPGQRGVAPGGAARQGGVVFLILFARGVLARRVLCLVAFVGRRILGQRGTRPVGNQHWWGWIRGPILRRRRRSWHLSWLCYAG